MAALFVTRIYAYFPQSPKAESGSRTLSYGGADCRVFYAVLHGSDIHGTRREEEESAKQTRCFTADIEFNGSDFLKARYYATDIKVNVGYTQFVLKGT